MAVSDDVNAGTAVTFDGAGGEFAVGPTDKTGRDFRARGLLRYVNRRYLQFAGTGEFFLKGGADSPENFLAYAEFDGTLQRREGKAAARKGEAKRAAVHRYGPHIRDWRSGDPTWRGGRGKGIIGALNYLAGQGMNSVYFLTMNVGGDGQDVWPWTSPRERERFDCSKLDQWEKQHLWGHLMAGGAGCEWYFGYRYPHNDLNAEDWRSRERMWELTRIALEFFQRELPFPEMRSADELTSSNEDYCLAKPGEIYAIYLPNGGSTEIELEPSAATFDVRWFNPQKGGELQRGSVATIHGPGKQSVGEPPSETDQDWVAVVRVR